MIVYSDLEQTNQDGTRLLVEDNYGDCEENERDGEDACMHSLFQTSVSLINRIITVSLFLHLVLYIGKNLIHFRFGAKSFLVNNQHDRCQCHI